MLAPANAIHTKRWVRALAGRGHRITLISQHPDAASYEGLPVVIDDLHHRGMAGYFLNALYVRRRLAVLKPDLLNVHYASGYGTTAALSGFRPALLSVWGSDVYDFPYEARWKARLLRYNLRRATRIASTSVVMSEQVERLVPDLPPPFITPFGVDLERFKPQPERDPQLITIGTVKTLAPKYGIDVLIRAFALLLGDDGIGRDLKARLRLVIVGGGEQMGELQALAKDLRLGERAVFVGPVPHEQVPTWLNRLDVYVAASRLDSESFGVAVIEASACGLPVVVTDVGGLPEVVEDETTGIIVPKESPTAIAEAIKRLLIDPERRQKMGEAGRQHVVAKYGWEHCIDVMEDAFYATSAHAGVKR